MTTQLERQRANVVERYDVDTLGAPFKVTVCDSVFSKIDSDSGEESIVIPDLGGLLNAVVRSRVLHPRKLNGEEIKFIRNVLAVKARPVAEFLDMTPEHFSRCEAGAKVMSTSNEKLLRLFAFLGATFFEEPELVLLKAANARNLKKKPSAKEEDIPDFVQFFVTMKIESVFDANDELHFEFSRRVPPCEKEIEEDSTGCEEHEKWEESPRCEAA